MKKLGQQSIEQDAELLATLLANMYQTNSWTPTVTQSGAVAITINRARYTKIGNLIVVTARLTMTGAGTGANDIVIGGLPATAAYAAALHVIGSGSIVDQSTAWYACNVVMPTTTTLKLLVPGNTAHAGTGPNFALAATDIISFTAIYEAV